MSAIIEPIPLFGTAVTPLPQGEPCVLVIFGASGDLTRRKLVPALYDPSCLGCMHPQCDVLGVGRTPISSEEFRVRMRGAAAASKEGRDFTEEHCSDFEKRQFYLVGDPNHRDFNPRLVAQMQGMRRDGSSSNHLFYVSTPASVARPIIDGLGSVGLNHNPHGWSCFVLEKPFGRDLNSASE